MARIPTIKPDFWSDEKIVELTSSGHADEKRSAEQLELAGEPPLQRSPMIMEIEPFVDAIRAAEFLCITPRRLAEMARAGEIPAHPIGSGRRKTWRFRLSEVAESVGRRGIIKQAVPRRCHQRKE